jgi:hypothetical protein
MGYLIASQANEWQGYLIGRLKNQALFTPREKRDNGQLQNREYNSFKPILDDSDV